MSRLLRLRGPGLAIFAIALFAFAALAAWRGFTLYQERAERLAAGRATVASAAVYVANYVARTVDLADLIADDTREFVEGHGGLAQTPVDELHRRLAGYAQRTSVDDYIIVTDAQGRVVGYSERTLPPRAVFSDRAWFRAHLGPPRGGYLGPAVKSRVNSRVVYTYSEALRRPDGTLEGVVSAAIAPTPPRPTRSRAIGEPTGQVWSPSGRLIVATHMDFDAAGEHLPQARPFAGAPAAGQGFLPAGPDRLLAYRVAEGRDLIATVDLSRDELLAPWRENVRDSGVLLLVSGLVMAGLATLAARFAGQDYRARLKTEQTAAELSEAVAEKDVLLREIHHRVKNNLQITSSLMQLQARSFADPDVRSAFEQTQQRLRSIGLVHDVLYNEDRSARVDLATYLDQLAGELATANGAAARGVSVSVEAEAVPLSPSQVTPLGLCVAEVLTNAFKHAFPEGRGGAIRVTARRAGAELEVVVRDDGRGFDGSPQRPGSLGLKLIEVLSRQLHGRSAFASEGGTVFTLVFPIRA
ncbi:MAG TPA: histidine kinase dimerization/phosphoacceptor domain -containing protein [Caulobacteraceae bacterium]|jgi:two-component sensor histidine kinase